MTERYCVLFQPQRNGGVAVVGAVYGPFNTYREAEDWMRFHEIHKSPNYIVLPIHFGHYSGMMLEP